MWATLLVLLSLATCVAGIVSFVVLLLWRRRNVCVPTPAGGVKVVVMDALAGTRELENARVKEGDRDDVPLMMKLGEM